MAQADIDELPRPRWWLKPLIAVVLVGLLGIVGVQLYRRFEPARLAKQGRAYFAQGDYRNAVLCAQRALQINPLNDDGARLMIDITEQLGSPATLAWRQQVALLHPDSATDALALATTALQQVKPDVARQALEGIPEGARSTAAYHEKAGLAALQRRDSTAAEDHFVEAAKLEPANDLHRYNLATLRVQSGDPGKRQAGAAVLADLATNGRLRLFALRSLVARHKQDRQFSLAIERSTELTNEKDAVFRDRLIHLELLRRAGRLEFPSALEAVQRTVVADTANVAVLVNWMRMEGLAREALIWVGTLEARISSAAPVARARAECFAATAAWAELQTLTAATEWGSDEYLRHAWEARARRESGDNALANAAFQDALSRALRNRDDLQRLAALIAGWGWIDEMREALWAAVDAPAPQWALQLLHRSYLGEGNTAGLLRVAIRALQLDPQSDAARNNVAILSLLRGVDLDRWLGEARELHTKAPTNAIYTSTYAFALHLHGRTREGLEVLRKLSPEALKEPSVAAYYGLLLMASGAKAEAKTYLDRAQLAPLLPEEKGLLEKALKL